MSEQPTPPVPEPDAAVDPVDAEIEWERTWSEYDEEFFGEDNERRPWIVAALRGLVDVQFRQSATRVLLPVVYILGLLLAFSRLYRDSEMAVLTAAGIGAGEAHTRFENRYRHKDGSYRTIVWSATSNPDEQLIYASARDRRPPPRGRADCGRADRGRADRGRPRRPHAPPAARPRRDRRGAAHARPRRSRWRGGRRG